MTALRYTTPSQGDWNKALPIGNGKLGAMIYGEGTSEHFQLNEDSVWFGQKEKPQQSRRFGKSGYDSQFNI